MTVLGSITTVCCVLLVCSKVIDGCTSGFMDLNLLRERAEKITNGGMNDDSLDNSFVILSGDSFSCSGTMTGLLFVGAVRSGKDRIMYPEIQIYRNTGGNAYTRQGNSQEIRLAEGDFSPDGVLQYNLTTPISYQSGDVLGVYQPSKGDSVVRVYYRQTAATTHQNSDSPMSSINLNDFSTVTDQEILISPISDSPSCTGNFLSRSALRQGALDININDVMRRDDQQRLFPDITFTCNGFITKWIVGGTTDNTESSEPELQIWRNTGGTSYTKANFSLLPFSTLVSNVAEYNLSTPLEFQEGDILGVYQPRRQDSALVVYYQRRDGPTNYEFDDPLFDVNLDTPDNDYDYPLVTVEISTVTPATTSVPSMMSSTVPAEAPATTDVPMTTNIAGVPITSSSGTETMVTSAMSPNTSPTVPDIAISSSPTVPDIATSPSVPASSTGNSVTASSIGTVPSDTTATLTSATPTQMLPPSGQSSNNTPAIVAAVFVILIVTVLVAVTAVVVILIVLRRKRKTKEAVITAVHYTRDESGELKDLGNPLYSEAAAVDSTKPIMELYSTVDANNYETPVSTMNRQISFYEQPAAPAAQTSFSFESPLYQWGIVVPTLSQRKDFTDPEGHYEFNEEIYSSVTQDEEYQTLNHSFFEETVIYWEPGSDCGAIYEQLADKRYREIVRQHIKIGEHLGSGQFGWVEKGVWSSPDGPVNVAIKTLKEDSSEVEKVKFLQEAAIMGQFHHANIVTLHGVVTVAEPPMIVLELVKNGDLREYLHTLQPTPGELAPASLTKQLLGYCRQIASGMEYLSKKSFVHRDLAARNILVDDKKTCKIADFGMSRDLSDSDYYVSQGGKIPIKWTAPEAVHFKKYSTASDVWSFGALMYEIWSLGHKPFEGKTNHEALNLIDTGYRLPPPPGCPRAVYQIMMDCWHPEASGRLSFSDLVSRLSQPEKQLLKWTGTEKSITGNSQSTMLGAPLETASNLHSDLQQQYL